MTRGLRGQTSGQTVQTARQLRGALTEAEQVLWSALRGSRMQGIKFRRQHPFGPYVLDFFCVKAQLVVELDGGIHDQPEQREYDEQRTVFLEENGLRVMRFRNEEVEKRLDEVLRKILEVASPSPAFGSPSLSRLPSGEGGGRGEGEENHAGGE